MNAVNSSKALYMPKSFQTTESNKTGSWRFLKPRYEDKTSPCSEACPAGEDIAMIEMLASQGMFKEAWETILLENPLPGVCGRVCFHPCEESCNRKPFDSPIAIHSLERFLADTAARNDLKHALQKLPQKPQKIAVVGSGPAGLSAAWFLSLLGYACDVYESAPEAGGILRWGIPEYRLPLNILKSEITRIESLGVNIITNRPVSESDIVELGKSYSAAFLGCGYGKGSPLGIPGESSGAVIDGLSFLKNIRAGGRPACGGLSAVIGGGNTAVDIARTVIRLGGQSAILYRRRRQDMPAFEDEIAMALEEGAELYELLAPASVSPADGRYRLTLQKMKIEGLDKDGRGRIVPDAEEKVIMDVERIFAATGAGVEETWINPPADRKAAIALSHCTIVRGTAGEVLAYGGDLVNRTKNVTHAIASGKQAAIALDAYFSGGMESIDPRIEACKIGDGSSLSMEIHLAGARSLRSSHVVRHEEINTDYFHFEPRVIQPRLLVEERRSSFDEIDLRIAANIAIREAGRCFNCGLCNQCDNCYLFCPDVAVIRGRNMENRHINYEYCKGCGLCAAECPRNAVTLGEEDI